MKLGLLGYPIDHSLSPEIYQRLLGDKLTFYKKFSYPDTLRVPPLEYFSRELNGLNITSPYKQHFINQILIESDLIRGLGSVNTLAFTPQGVFGTNTDFLAVNMILKDYQAQYPRLMILLLGSGAMAKVTSVIAQELSIPLRQFSRHMTPGFSNLDIRPFSKKGTQLLIINACSRDYTFTGEVNGGEIFWDYNYSFIPHQNTLPLKGLIYKDGQEMLELQAKAAVKFWERFNP